MKKEIMTTNWKENNKKFENKSLHTIFVNNILILYRNTRNESTNFAIFMLIDRTLSHVENLEINIVMFS